MKTYILSDEELDSCGRIDEFVKMEILMGDYKIVVFPDGSEIETDHLFNSLFSDEGVTHAC